MITKLTDEQRGDLYTKLQLSLRMMETLQGKPLADFEKFLIFTAVYETFMDDVGWGR